jgi:hypothetical protein
MAEMYVVMGTTGEYSDRTEWPIAVYAYEALAKQHVGRATVAGNTSIAESGRYGPHPTTPLLGEFRSDYTGTSFYYMAVPLLTDVPEA